VRVVCVFIALCMLGILQCSPWVSDGQAGSQHVTYGYTPGATQLQTITTAAGTGQDLTTTFGYSGALLTSVTTPYTPITHTWSIAYDAQGRVASISSPLSGTLGQPGYTPAYTTAFTYTPGRTVVVEGVGTTAALTTTYDLDAHGQPIAVTDGLTNRTASAYDQEHDITRVTDARGNVTTNAYAYVGQYGSAGLVTETDQPGIAAYIPGNATSPVTTTYRYDPTTYDLLERDTAEGARTVYAYDGPHHQVTSVIDRLSSLSPCRQSFTVAHARTSTAPHVQARATRARATKARRVNRIAPHLRPHTDCAPTGDRWRGTINAYDARGQLIATTDARGVSVPDTSIGQTPVAALNPMPPVAATHTYTYTPAGDLWSVSSPPVTTLNPTDAGQTTGPVTTTYGYDADGNQVAVTSPNGAVTTAGYDHQGRLTQLAQPTTMLFDGSTRAPTATIGYDGDGNVVSTTDGAGDPTTRAYDPLGRLVSSTNAVDETTVLTYTATRLAQVRTPAGNTTSYGYDAAGRRTGVTDPIGTLTRFGLDAVGNTTAIAVPLDTQGASSVDRRTYDGLNQLATDTWQGTNELTATVPQTTTYSYDHDGNLVQAQAPNGDVTYRTYDYADQPRAVTVYPSGALAPVTNAPPAASQTFALDPAGNLTDQLDFNQRDHSYTLDGAGRTTQRVDSYSGQTLTAITTTVGDDPNGNVRALSRQADGVSGTQASTATYNALDWLTSQDDGQGATAYGYDAAGRLRTQSLLGGAASVTATLDAAGRTTAIDDNAAGTVATSLFSYTPDDRPYTATLPGGVGEQRYYDRNNRLRELDAQGPFTGLGTTQLNRILLYGRNPQGQTTAISLTNYFLYQQIGRDALGQVTADALGDGSPYDSGTSKWTYDGNGNIQTRADDNAYSGFSAAYGYGYTSGMTPAAWLPNELVTAVITPARGSAQTTQYGYDASGDTTAITATGAVTALAYNSAGLFTSATLPDGRTVAVTYNARGLRDTLSVTPSGQGSPSFRERFLYRGDLVGQVSVTGTAPVTNYTETFLYRPDGTPLELLYQTPGQPAQRYWYAVDAQGSVLALTDASGTAVDQYQYDLWGASLALNSPYEPLYEHVPQPLRFAGYWDDSWAGGPLPWYWLSSRYYDPVLERFLQPDPSSQDGVRSYAYAHNNPVDLTDPSGLSSEPPGVPIAPTLDGGGGVVRTSQLVAGVRTEANALRGTLLPGEGDISVVMGPDGEFLSDASGSYDPGAFDREGAIGSARGARRFLQAIQGRLGRKVASVNPDGTLNVSGYGAKINGVPREALGVEPSNVADVLDAAGEMGISYRPEGVTTANDSPSLAEEQIAGHAEKQGDVRAPGVPQATTSPPCATCSDFLGARATFDAGNGPRVVDDPYGTTIYYPNGTIELVAKQAYPAGYLVP